MRRLSLLLLTLFVACGGSDAATAPNPASASLAGSYSMKTINATPLPFTYQKDTYKIVITNDVLVIADGGTWSETLSATVTVSGGAAQPQTVANSGTWTRAGTSVSFKYSDGSGTYAGTFTGSGFSLHDSEFSYTFGK